MIDWDNYRHFLAVAALGSLSAAARQLGVSQPTVGRHIQELETRLGVRLFERLSHGYILTPLGEHIRERVVCMEQEALTIERQASGADARLAGPVSISTTEGLAMYWLMPKLPQLKQRFPGLDLELIIDIRLADLLRREADIALRVGTPGSDKLVGRCVGQIVCGLFGSESYLAARGEPRRLEDLSQHLIIESVGDIADLVQVHQLREAAKGATVNLRCNHVVTQVAAARAGLGLLAVPTYKVLEAPELRRVLRKDFDVQLDLWLLTHRDLKHTARIRAVLDFLYEEIHRDHAFFQNDCRQLQENLCR